MPGVRDAARSDRGPQRVPSPAEVRSAEETALAKVNLFLRVTGRRPDGYHLLDSLVVFAEVGDRLRGVPAPDLTLAVDGPFASGVPAGADNLVMRAARALAAVSGTQAGASLTLTKSLPHAAGLGGGSADAAAALRLLRRLWRLPLGGAELLPLAGGLGADVPACLASVPVRMGGIGSVLGPAPVLPEFGLCLVNPGIGLPTARVFDAWRGPVSGSAELPAAFRDVQALVAWLGNSANDLEVPALRLCPAIAEILEALRAGPDCLLARMSGAGATCFGMYGDRTAAARAAARLNRTGWWRWAGGAPDHGPCKDPRHVR